MQPKIGYVQPKISYIQPKISSVQPKVWYVGSPDSKAHTSPVRCPDLQQIIHFTLPTSALQQITLFTLLTSVLPIKKKKHFFQPRSTSCPPKHQWRPQTGTSGTLFSPAGLVNCRHLRGVISVGNQPLMSQGKPVDLKSLLESATFVFIGNLVQTTSFLTGIQDLFCCAHTRRPKITPSHKRRYSYSRVCTHTHRKETPQCAHAYRIQTPQCAHAHRIQTPQCPTRVARCQASFEKFGFFF